MKRYFILLSCLSILNVYSQKKDSINKAELIELDQTAISGQYNNQSVKKSIYEVKVITREIIDRQAGNTLADVLNQTLNMNIIPNSSTGKSTVRMFGLDGQYFKILVDNIPLINDEGFGNNTDLTQINLDDIEQIEIVEGAMGVEYGSNSIAGVINIITKTGSKNTYDISAILQEETVNDEYNWNNKGKHIQSLKIGHKFSDKIYANLSFSRNDFQGFFNDKKGKNYPFKDRLRGYDWIPKFQNSAKALVQYNDKNFRLFYKFEYFNEKTKYYNADLELNHQVQTDTDNPKAKDKKYTTDRIYNHLNIAGRYKNVINYDISLSYQEQKRKLKSYTYEILTGNENNIKNFDYESRKIYYSKGMFSNFINKNDYFDFQFGYEIDQTKGYASPISMKYNSDPDKPVERKIGTYDIFASSEISLNDKISFRPGARIMFSEKFKTQYVMSFTAKYVFAKNWEFRTILGTSPRLPNYNEMYSYMVDVNHDIRGNENLNPEKGISAFLHLKNKWNLNSLTSFEQKLSVWKINLEDKIELVPMVSEDGLQRYLYKNIDKYKVQGITYLNQFSFGNFFAGIGVTITGIKQSIDQSNVLEKEKDKYFYQVQANANLSYKFPKSNTIISAFYKYNGEQQQYVLRTNPTNRKEQYLQKGYQQGFSWLDASVRQSFFKNRFDLTLGVRNLFDVKNLRNTTNLEGAHTAASTNMMYGYGRSYFVKIAFNLGIN